MKMYKKSDLQIVDGMLVTEGGDIVLPDTSIICQANELETLKQKADYLAAQPEATPMPSLDGFERKSIRDAGLGRFEASTPTLDAKVFEAEALMDEIDDMAAADNANAMLAGFAELIAFANADYVVDCGRQSIIHLFDTPTLGSVLELKGSDIVGIIATVCGFDPDAHIEG